MTTNMWAVAFLTFAVLVFLVCAVLDCRRHGEPVGGVPGYIRRGEARDRERAEQAQLRAVAKAARAKERGK